MSFDMTTLEYYAKVQGGYAYKSSDFLELSPNKVLKIKNVRFGVLDYSEPGYISDELAQDTLNWKLKEGDTLISMTGSGPNSPQSLVGRTARVWRGEPQAWFNQRVGRIRLHNEESIHPDFIFYWLSLPQSQDYLVSNSSGSANQANISGKIIESLPTPKVDYKTSEKIATVAKGFDKKIIVSQKIAQTLEQMAQAIFKSWFVDFEPVKAKIAALEAGGSKEDALLAAMQAISGKGEVELTRLQAEQPEQYAEIRDTAELFPSAMQESELGEIPEGWSVPSFEEIAVAKQGKYLPKDKMSPTISADSYVPVWGGNGVLGYTKACSYPSPVVLMTCRGSNCGLIRHTESESWVSNNAFACSPRIGSVWFLLTYLNASSFDDCISGSAQPQITYSALRSKRLAFPVHEKICNHYSELIQAMFDQVIQLRKETLNLESLRDALLPKLLSGELEVQEDLCVENNT